MKRINIILLLAAVLLSVQGCDFVRSLAGRPTSADLEVMRKEKADIEARAEEEARARAYADSVAKAVADSVAIAQIRMAHKVEALEAIRKDRVMVLPSLVS
ncbi:MAG: hypothetical protein HUJ94_07520, partial [Bacteroidales bacterium]|nr:hypothetical protein [Bacteroidales bacterium]